MTNKPKNPERSLDVHVYPPERIYATLSRKLPDKDKIVKYAIPLRISQAKSTDKPDGLIFQTLSGILQTPSAELVFVDIARCFHMKSQRRRSNN